MQDDSTTAGQPDEFTVSRAWGVPFGIIPVPVLTLPPELVKTYAALASFASGDHRCRPSLGTLEKRMATPRRTIIRNINRLVELGVIVRLERGAPNRATVYELGSGADATSVTHDTKVVSPMAPQQTKEQTRGTEKGNAPARGTNPRALGLNPRAGNPDPGSIEGRDPESVLAAFNVAFGTNYSGEAWLTRIRRRWPEGWTLEDWQAAIIALHSGPRFWERDGGRVHPGHLIGRDGTWLLALREQAEGAARDEISRRRGRELREAAYRELDERKQA